MGAPGLLLGAYPERLGSAPESRSTLLALLAQLRAAVVAGANLDARRLQAFVASVNRLDAQYAARSRSCLQECLPKLRAELSIEGLSERLLAQAFALIRAVAVQELGVRPFDTQLMAARVMLGNQLAEMATGEGKTLAAAICAATAALAGTPVHVVTVNDYLVARDANALQPLYAALGLSVGQVVAAHDPEQRRLAYACDITYCTAKELVFDYLRDRVARGPRQSELQLRAAHFDTGAAAPPQPLLRGLCMAIVDEADSVLIDEARVPLILARGADNGGEVDYHAKALALAQRLRFGVDFRLDVSSRSAHLTEAGMAKIEHLSRTLGSVWHNRTHREETVSAALAAWHMYQSDRDYLVRAGVVVIIDEATGRLAPGRMWSRGLHQLIELKEGCQPTGEQVTAAQITYQRFFARYLRLGGMSGTLCEARSELGSVYGLEVVKIALRCPSRRVVLPTRLVGDRDAQWRGVTQQVRRITRAGRPVLIGTDSVADSESLSEVLTRAGLAHRVLNARHDLLEAQIVAAAGEAGCITVATNMAGRGTDIALGEGVAERGGLHVICCQHNASRRIDRQLIGRCARQGDPGSAQTVVALSKPLLVGLFPAWLLRHLAMSARSRSRWWVTPFVRLPQVLEERRQRAQRLALQQQDERAERELFSGLQGE